jgi:hypothetical protein
MIDEQPIVWIENKNVRHDRPSAAVERLLPDGISQATRRCHAQLPGYDMTPLKLQFFSCIGPFGAATAGSGSQAHKANLGGFAAGLVLGWIFNGGDDVRIYPDSDNGLSSYYVPRPAGCHRWRTRDGVSG